MRTKVAFVVLCWNNQTLLKECFESIFAQSYQDTVVYMVDNGSEDDSVSYVRENFPEVKLIEAGHNYGFAKGNNIGITEALKDDAVGYVALINTDARVENQWLEQIVEFAKLKPKGALFQGTTLDYYDSTVVDSTHIYVAQNSEATQGSFRELYTGEMGPKKVLGTNAAATVITRAFIDAQPFDTYFDETMFMYLEDVDASLRATVMGWDNYLVPSARAHHMGSASSGGGSFSLYLTFRNNAGMLVKNLPLLMLIKLLPKAMRVDFDTFRHLRKTDRKEQSWVVVKGRLAGILRLPIFMIKGLRVSKHRRINSDYLWRLMKKGY